MQMRFILVVTGALAAAACPPPSTTSTGPRATGPMVVHGDPAATPPLNFFDFPFPNNLFRSGGIQVRVPDFGEERDVGSVPMHERIAQGLAERHGFSGTASIMFTFDALLDVDSLAVDGAVVLIELDGPDRGRHLRTRIRFRDDEKRLFITPDYGERMRESHTYAALVTTKVKGRNGEPARPSPGMTAQLGGSGAYEQLRQMGFAQAEIAAATIFTIDDGYTELQALRDAVYEGDAPALVRTRHFPEANYDLDRLMGVPSSTGLGYANGAAPHEHIGHVVHGTFNTPLFISPEPGQNGLMQFSSGRPTVRGHEDVPFTLVLPANPVTPLPLVMFQHGLGGARHDVMVVAEELCRRGMAVAGIDLPFHGSRLVPHVDQDNNITHARDPDGIGDNAGLQHAFYALGITSNTPGLQTLTPMIVRDSLRQGHADMMGFVRAMLDGDTAPLVEGIAEWNGLEFNRVYFMGESFGSIHGVPVVATDERIAGAFFSVGGGGLVVDLLLNSPTYGPPFGLFLYQALGMQTSLNDDLTINYAQFPPELEWKLQLFQTIVDPADPITYAPLLALRQRGSAPRRNVVFVAPFSDESVPNQAQEALAMAAGAQAVRHGAEPMLRYGRMDVVDGPLSGNVQGFTVGFAQFDPATHGMLTRRSETKLKEPEFPPFRDLPEEIRVQNPTDALQKTAAQFFEVLGEGGNAFSIAE